jgi:putative addiction module component (TIGR02574 family)
MRIGLKKVADDVFKLPARSRARLAERLIMSLEETEEPEAEQEWLVEIEPRSVELKSGKATGVPTAKVFQESACCAW